MPKDFSGLNLIGKSFKGHDLSGANFSGADIRGVNFKGAKLVNANFSNAKAGLRGVSKGVLFFISLIFFVISGPLSMTLEVTITGSIINPLFFDFDRFKYSIKPAHLIILIFFILLLIIAVIATRRGKFFVLVFVLVMSLGWGFLQVAVDTVPLAGNGVFGVIHSTNASLQLAVPFLALALAGILLEVVALFVAWAIVGSGAIATSIAGAVAGSWIFFKVRPMFGFPDLTNSHMNSHISMAVVISIFILSYYIFWKTLKEDEQFTFLRKIGLFFVPLGGTDFRGADLTDTNFSEAVLNGSRFNKDTTIKRTCWRNVKKIELARLSRTILENLDVRELLITGKVKDRNKSFIGINLKGAHFVNIDFDDIDFTEADISNATLENASLKNANLTKIQAVGVEFKGANLTGACLEAWNIDSTTQLLGVHANYVYLRRNKEERRPHKGIYRKGEFSKLFQEILNTVDLIFKNGIDRKAFEFSFNKLSEKIRVENEGAEIEIESVKKIGDSILVKINVPFETNKAEAYSDFMLEYDRLKLIKEKHQVALNAKDREIAIYQKENIDLKGMLIFNRLTEVEIMKEKKRKIDFRGNITTGSRSTVNLGEISGTVNNVIEQLPSSSNPDQQGLKELLSKLQDIIEDAEEKELRPEEKKDALEEVKKLATIGQQSNPDEKQTSSIRRSLKFFKGLIADLPKVSNLAKELGILISAISSIFGI